MNTNQHGSSIDSWQSVWIAILVFAQLGSNAQAISPNQVDVRGRITHLKKASEDTPKKILGHVLIEGVKEADTSVDKASVTVTTETRLFIQQGQGRKPIEFKDLKEGQLVEAKFTGPIRESYPVQADAAEILILKE